jgi:deoxyribonuclease (pyrimidine dimer)
MARVNVGVAPAYLSDQHLIAESVEITMITGGLRLHKYKIKGVVPSKFPMGKGHINFFKDKLLYLRNRLEAVNAEMRLRGFKPGTYIDLSEFPKELINDWKPTMEDSKHIRERIADRLANPLKAKKGFHRFYGKLLDDNLQTFQSRLLESDLFFL